MFVSYLRDLCKTHFVHLRGVLFTLEHLDHLDELEGAVIFLKMIIVSYNMRNRVLIQTDKSMSLAVLSHTSLHVCALVLQVLPNETIRTHIEAAQFLEKLLKTLSKQIDFHLP